MVNKLQSRMIARNVQPVAATTKLTPPPQPKKTSKGNTMLLEENKRRVEVYVAL